MVTSFFLQQLIKMDSEESCVIQYKDGVITMPKHYNDYSTLLAKYFRTKRLSSFQRQLTNYGFSVIKHPKYYIYSRPKMSKFRSVKDISNLLDVSDKPQSGISQPENTPPSICLPQTRRLLHVDSNETLHLLETIWSSLYYDR